MAKWTLASMHTMLAPLVLAQTRSSPPPSSPGLPPLFPNFRYGNLHYAIVQEIRTSSVDNADAQERCGLLSRSAVATIEPLAFSLIDSSGCPAGNQTMVVSCTFTSSKEVVRDFVGWVSTSPLPNVPTTCAPMQIAHTSRVVMDMNPSPSHPPSHPLPPTPPPRPLPSPPPPPPSPPPSPPASPLPPCNPPSAPPSPPSPPEDPPLPPSPPASSQIAAENLCHPTCVSCQPDCAHPPTSDCAHPPTTRACSRFAG